MVEREGTLRKRRRTREAERLDSGTRNHESTKSSDPPLQICLASQTPGDEEAASVQTRNEPEEENSKPRKVGQTQARQVRQSQSPFPQKVLSSLETSSQSGSASFASQRVQET